MTSLTVSGIAPFLDFAGLMMFVEKISIYLLIGVTLYFSRFSKQDIDTKHNSEPNADLSTRDIFNEILATRDARFTTRDEKLTSEVQRILTMLNTSTARLDEIEQVLQTHHNNLGVTSEIELINGSIVASQNENNQGIEPTEEAEARDDANQSEASSDSSQRSFSDMTSEIWNQFKIIFDRIMAERGCSFDDMCNIVMVDHLNLGVGKLSKDIIKNYYRRINDLRGSNLDKIGSWIDSKTVTRNSE